MQDSDNSCLLDIALEIFPLCFSLKENQVTHLHCSWCRTAIIPLGSPKNNSPLFHSISSVFLTAPLAVHIVDRDAIGGMKDIATTST